MVLLLLPESSQLWTDATLVIFKKLKKSATSSGFIPYSLCSTSTFMETLKENTSKAVDKVKGEVKQNVSGWSEMVEGLVDKLTGKDMAITYEFRNLEVDIPKATGPDGKEIGSAKWTINGRFVISTEVRQKSDSME